MPASRPAGRIGGSRNSTQNKGYAQAVLDEFTNQENRSVLLAIGIFTVGYDFQLALHKGLRSSCNSLLTIFIGWRSLPS